MFDFGLGSSELLLVAIIALIVIGPKDLPRLLRTMGQYMRKIQGMAREFQNHLNEAAKETGVEDVKKDVKGMTNFTVTADLDKQGADIKKAIESSASKAPPANGAGGAKTGGAAKGEDEPAKIDTTKASPAAGTKPAAAAKPKSSESESAKSGPAGKPKPAAKPKTAAKPKSAAKPKPAAKPKSKSGQKADPARETAKS